MLNLFRKLTYAARVMLSRSGEPQTIDVAGRPVTLLHGGGGPPFVYLHSSLGESVRWLPFHDAWAKRFAVYAPLHPGFGTSGGFDGMRNIDDMAFALVELFDALGIEQAVVGGVSLGGWIAAEFAARWPERVGRLWLSGAPGLWVPEQPLPDLFRYLTQPAMMREMLFHDPRGPMATMIVQDDPDDERRMFGYQAMTVLARMVWERPYSPKLAARLHRVKCPVLLLWGEHDRLVPPAYGREYAKHLPQARWETLPGCGHLGMFEKEPAFVEAVGRFAAGG
ncbi:MAG: alpha/beta fold hydrolase [Gemmataceae bacterium]